MRLTFTLLSRLTAVGQGLNMHSFASQKASSRLSSIASSRITPFVGKAPTSIHKPARCLATTHQTMEASTSGSSTSSEVEALRAQISKLEVN